MARVRAAPRVEDDAVQSVRRVDGGLNNVGQLVSMVARRKQERAGAHIGHVRREVDLLRVPQRASDLATARRKALEVDGEHERRLLDREELFGVDELLAPVRMTPSQSAHFRFSPEGQEQSMNDTANALLALVLVLPAQLVDADKVVHRVPEGVCPVAEVKREVEDRVERVAVVAAREAVHARAEAAAEDLVDKGRLLDLLLEFAAKAAGQQPVSSERGKGEGDSRRLAVQGGSLHRVDAETKELVRVFLPTEPHVLGNLYIKYERSGCQPESA